MTSTSLDRFDRQIGGCPPWPSVELVWGGWGGGPKIIVFIPLKCCGTPANLGRKINFSRYAIDEAMKAKAIRTNPKIRALLLIINKYNGNI